MGGSHDNKDYGRADDAPAMRVLLGPEPGRGGGGIFSGVKRSPRTYLLELDEIDVDSPLLRS